MHKPRRSSWPCAVSCLVVRSKAQHTVYKLHVALLAVCGAGCPCLIHAACAASGAWQPCRLPCCCCPHPSWWRCCAPACWSASWSQLHPDFFACPCPACAPAACAASCGPSASAQSRPAQPLQGPDAERVVPAPAWRQADMHVRVRPACAKTTACTSISGCRWQFAHRDSLPAGKQRASPAQACAVHCQRWHQPLSSLCPRA